MATFAHSTVTATQLNRESSMKLAQVREHGHTLVVTNQGEVIGVVAPTARATSYAFATLPCISTRAIARGERSITGLIADQPHAITFHNVPYAVVIPAAEWNDLDDLFDDVDGPGATVPRTARAAGRSTQLRRQPSSRGRTPTTKRRLTEA